MDILNYISLIFAIFLFFCFVYGYGKKIIRIQKNRIKNLQELEKTNQKKSITKIGACIIKMECYIKKKGIKSPESIPTFCVTFLTDNSKENTYEISESLYFSLEEGKKGILATVDGEFFDFYVNDCDL